jgi:CRP/FNR family transcriptional regulator, anaerobic regulatory protein
MGMSALTARSLRPPGGTREAETLTTVFGAHHVLSTLAPRQRVALLRGSRLVLLAEGEPAVEPLRGWPVLLSGAAELWAIGPVPRRLETLRPGRSSAAAVAALLDSSGAPLRLQHLAGASTPMATPAQVLLISAQAFATAMSEPAFASAIHLLLARRVNEWIFEPAPTRSAPRLSARLAALLLREGAAVEETQQALAEELGTARECVSRQLRRFARAGWVRVRRERIEPLDAGALARVAAGQLAPPA